MEKSNLTDDLYQFNFDRQNEPKTLFIIDDELMFCELLSKEFEDIESYRILGYSTSGEKALLSIKQKRPNAVLIDVKLINENGIDIAENIKSAFPLTTIIMLSGYFNEILIAQSIRAGANGILSKTMSINSLLMAIDEILNTKKIYIDKCLGVDYHELMANMDGKNLYSITTRELDVLRLIVQEHTATEISKKLNISVKTVRNHKSNLMSKLDIKTDAALIKYALSMAIY